MPGLLDLALWPRKDISMEQYFEKLIPGETGVRSNPYYTLCWYTAQLALADMCGTQFNNFLPGIEQ
ncbi:hypothetical protein GX51_02493 [Blastomyces parvus]|uniref:Uncharacterized protein n=1 Tax=Blastomyces parvus TaxID=2060905 RepID=A0A2B7XB23_9EURO|nr:hypothetical protein GX51_02493 [Blastomyces parvus]